MIQVVLYNQSIVVGDGEVDGSWGMNLRFPMAYHECNPDPAQPTMFAMGLRPLLQLFAVESLHLPAGSYAVIAPAEGQAAKLAQMYEEAVQHARAAAANIVLSRQMPKAAPARQPLTLFDAKRKGD